MSELLLFNSWSEFQIQIRRGRKHKTTYKLGIESESPGLKPKAQPTKPLLLRNRRVWLDYNKMNYRNNPWCIHIYLVLIWNISTDLLQTKNKLGTSQTDRHNKDTRRPQSGNKRWHIYRKVYSKFSVHFPTGVNCPRSQSGYIVGG